MLAVMDVSPIAVPAPDTPEGFILRAAAVVAKHRHVIVKGEHHCLCGEWNLGQSRDWERVYFAHARHVATCMYPVARALNAQPVG